MAWPWDEKVGGNLNSWIVTLYPIPYKFMKVMVNDGYIMVVIGG